MDGQSHEQDGVEKNNIINTIDKRRYSMIGHQMTDVPVKEKQTEKNCEKRLNENPIYGCYSKGTNPCKDKRQRLKHRISLYIY